MFLLFKQEIQITVHAGKYLTFLQVGAPLTGQACCDYPPFRADHDLQGGLQENSCSADKTDPDYEGYKTTT